MSEIAIYILCFALGYAVGWLVAIWQFENVLRILAKIYEGGDVDNLLHKLRERTGK